MNKSRKVVIAFLLAGIMSASVFTAAAAEPYGAVPVSSTDTAVPTDSDVTPLPFYLTYTGVVAKIVTSEGADGSMTIQMESDENGPAYATVSKDTYISGDKEIAEGDTVTVYYEADRPMIMIYPPQYSAAIVLVNPDKESFVKADLFNSDLVSRDEALKLNIGENTEILALDGSVYTGEIKDKKLLVFYTVSTKSIPAQTTPSKIVVLGDPEASDSYNMDVSGMNIVVEGKVIEALPAFTTENGVVMVPLRAIAEALGYTVSWDNDTQTVTLNQAISLQIGRDYYVYMRTAPIELGAAPILKNDRTFVPLNYFRDVLKLNNAYVFENQIVINNQEKMN